MSTHPLPKVSEGYTRFPTALITHLRRVVDSASPSDAFACYCNLLEWLTNYLNSLANSVYIDRSADAIDERLEKQLRSTPAEPNFGLSVAGLRAFAASTIEFGPKLPELHELLSAKSLPTACVRLAQAFKLIRQAREDYEIPPSRLTHYLTKNLPPDGQMGKVGLEGFLSALSPFRNKGHGHQAEETWFPRDRIMYEIVLSFIHPAVDELLTWTPLGALLSCYEIVQSERAQVFQRDGDRGVVISRPNVSDAVAPLGESFLRLGPTFQAGHGSQFVARRTELPNRLDAVTPYVRFPRALQSSELLVQRYAEVYLQAYLERGLITPTQRETKLTPTASELGISTTELSRVEGEIQQAINLYSGDEAELPDPSLRRLAALLGDRWQAVAERVPTLLEALPERRKNYIFEQIENNAIMSFVQLRAESELSEPDLDTVLGELEQDELVRQINASVQSNRLNGHFKAQDPSKPQRLRSILVDLQAEPRPPRKGYPAPLWRLVRFCAELLADDGFALDEAELEINRALFSSESEVALEEQPRDSGATMVLRVGDEELRPTTVRELYGMAWAAMEASGRDPSSVLPFLIGKTRYLVAREPAHANGTRFAVPIQVGGVVFEGNLRHAQALAEVIRLLRTIGLDAASPDIEQPRHEEVEEVETPEEADEADDERVEARSKGLGLTVTPSGQDEAVEIWGSSVRRFFAALLDFLIEKKAPLSEVVPVSTGRVRYLLSEEPYHSNGRPFDSMIERDGYFMNTAYTHEQALLAAAALCDALKWHANPLGESSEVSTGDAVPLRVRVGDTDITADDVPSLFRQAMLAFFEQGILSTEDVPYKSGRVRYLISRTPTHDHGRGFIRPIEIDVGGQHYYIESNVSRQGAIDLIERVIASKRSVAAEVG